MSRVVPVVEKQKQHQQQQQQQHQSPQTALSAMHSVRFPASLFAIWLLLFEGGAFGLTLWVALTTHFAGIVKNEWYSEWWPSISAVVGDYAPERNIFTFGMALVAPAKFACAFLQGYQSRLRASGLHASPAAHRAATFVTITGLLRVLSAGGWIFVSSSDHGLFHALSLFVYLVVGCLYYLAVVYLSVLTDTHERSRGASWRDVLLFWWRVLVSALFFASLVAALVMFVEHKLHRVIGAYAWYSVFEWSLLLIDMCFDAALLVDLHGVDVTVGFPAVVSGTPDHRARHETAHTVAHTAAYMVDSFVGQLLELGAALLTWTLVTELITLVWFFPLVYMDVTGYEVMVAFYFLPAALLAGRRWRAGLVWNRALLWALALPGVWALHFVPHHVHRLAVLSVSTGLALTATMGSWWLAGGAGMASLWAHLSALLAFLCLRMTFLSANPISAFPDVCRLTTVVGVPLLTALWFRDRRLRRQLYMGAVGGASSARSAAPMRLVDRAGSGPSASERQRAAAAGKTAAGGKAAVHTAARGVPAARVGSARPSDGLCAPVRHAPWLRAGLLLGSVFFLTHYLFTEHGVVARYVDVAPFPGGALVILLLAAGVLAARWPLLWASPVGVVPALGGALLFYYFDGYLGFAGGAMLALVTGALWPVAVANAQRCPPGRTLLAALLAYFAGILGSVWVVAYNFVPFGGPQMREAPQYVIFTFVLTAIGAALLLADRYLVRGATALRGRPALLLLWVLSVGLSVSVVLRVHSAVQLTGHVHHPLAAREWARRVPVPSVGAVPVWANSTDLNAMIWTIHFGYDNAGVLNFAAVEEVIRALDMDVVGLLETDLSRPFLGNRDLVEWLSVRLGLYADFGPTTKQNTWGCALLSRFPITASTHYLLPSPEGELACALRATLDVRGVPVDVLVTHMGNDRDVLDRKLQAEALSHIAQHSHPRFLFLGYVTSAPHSPNYRQLLAGGHLLDIDPEDQDRWCQYILYRGLQRRTYARIQAGRIADTEVQMARFRVTAALPAHTVWRDAVPVPAGRVCEPEQLPTRVPSGPYYYKRYWRPQADAELCR